MKYLDEQIEITVSGIYVRIDGTYPYSIKDSNGTILFVGNVFLSHVDTEYTFNCTDVIRNQKYVPDELLKKNFYSMFSKSVNLVNSYIVELTIDSTVYSSSPEKVVLIYRYPNRKSIMESEINDWTALNWRLEVPLQGRYSDSEGYGHFVLTPHYPYISTSEYILAVSTIIDKQWDNQEEGIEISVSGALEGETLVDNIYPSQVITCRLDNFYSDLTPTSTPNAETLVDIGGDYAAIIDTKCISHYYLMWQDRYGSFQSQPFNDYVTYSEDFEIDEIVSYTGERQIKNISINPKWKINSNWISEEVYPYYESIFTSPYLLLYDTYEDKSYNVIVKAEYTEKTFKNQKKLFNLTLELEQSEKQNIIY